MSGIGENFWFTEVRLRTLLEHSAGMNLKTHVFVIIVLCPLLFLTACPDYQQSKAQPVFIEALSDFVFVGAGNRDLLKVPAHHINPRAYRQNLELAINMFFITGDPVKVEKSIKPYASDFNLRVLR